MQYTIYILNSGRKLMAKEGKSLLFVLQEAGEAPDAPCGGHGKCGKCRVTVNGQEQLACETIVSGDMEVLLPRERKTEILTDSGCIPIEADGRFPYTAAFDIGTTTVVCYLMDGREGKLLAQTSCVNPQTKYGADVISRIQYAMDVDAHTLSRCIRQALDRLIREASDKAGISPEKIGAVAIVGNTAMHHLLLGIDPRPLTVPPYMPAVYEAMELPAETSETGELIPVTVTGAQRLATALQILKALEDNDIVGDAKSVDVTQLNEILLWYGSRYEVHLGDNTKLDYKIACMNDAILQMSDYQTGILDISFTTWPDQVGYTPFG